MKKNIYKVAILGAAIVGVMVPSDHAFNGPAPPAPPPPLSIIKVPDHLFGSAAYATPIKFRIASCNTATISQIVATFKWEGKTKALDISSRFVAEDGPAQANGTTNTYTAFIPSSFYDNAYVDGLNGGTQYGCNGAQFSLSVTFVPTVWGVTLPQQTLDSDGNTGFITYTYVDERIDCVELPSGTSGYAQTISLSSATQAAAGTTNGKTEFTQFMAASTSIMPRVVTPPINGYDAMTAQCGVTGNRFYAYCRLYDDTDYNIGGTGYGIQARAYAMQRGGYFNVSYGGKHMTPLGAETVMDLSRITGNYDYDLFSGEFQVNVVKVYGTGLNLTGIASSVFGVVKAFVGSNAWTQAFGVALNVFNAIEQIDTDASATIYDVAEANANVMECRHDRTSGTTNLQGIPMVQGNTHRDIKRTGVGCNVGDQIFISVNLNSSVAAISKPPWSPFGGTFEVEVIADVGYAVQTAADLSDMVVTTH